MLNALDLFSGIAGNTLGLGEYTRTIAYCEQDRHAQSVLISRMSDGSIEKAPICTDVTKLDGHELKGIIDIIVGGFPCQDISIAGNGKGLEGERSGLFFEVCRLVKEIKPGFVFLENVPAIRTRGLREVVRSLTDLGYDCRWTCVSAAEVGAPHIRKRWFLLAHRQRGGVGTDAGTTITTENERSELQQENRQTLSNDSYTVRSILANANNAGRKKQRFEKPGKKKCEAIKCKSWWEAEPNVGRVVDGLPVRVDRIKRLGNAVVPLQAKTAFEKLMGGGQ